MYQTISKNQFRDAFHRMNRGDNFRYEALGSLYDFLEEVECVGAGYELDVIALCCGYSELEPEEILEQYDYDTIEEDRDNLFIIDVEGRTSLIVAE